MLPPMLKKLLQKFVMLLTELKNMNLLLRMQLPHLIVGKLFKIRMNIFFLFLKKTLHMLNIYNLLLLKVGSYI